MPEQALSIQSFILAELLNVYHENFLATAFHFTRHQVFFLAVITGVKLLISISGMAPRLRTPFLWIGVGAFVVLLAALGIGGHIENQGHTVEGWLADRRDSKGRIRLARFLEWGQTLPMLFGYAAFLFLILPTSVSVLLVVLGSIILQNSYAYLSRNGRA